MAGPQNPGEGCSYRNTNWLERPLRRLFEGLGSGVAACPWPFVLVPLLLSGGLGSGFLFLPQRQANDIEGQFTPTGGPAKAERDFVRQHFPTNDSERFSIQQLPTEGAYAAFIAVAPDGVSVLAATQRHDVQKLDEAMRDRGYEQVCARSDGFCVSPNPLLPMLGDAEADALKELTFPGSGPFFLGTALGGVRTDPSGRVLSARALKLVYYLREDGPEAAESRRWLEDFLQDAPSDLAAMNFTSIQVAEGRVQARGDRRDQKCPGSPIVGRERRWWREERVWRAGCKSLSVSTMFSVACACVYRPRKRVKMFYLFLLF